MKDKISYAVFGKIDGNKGFDIVAGWFSDYSYAIKVFNKYSESSHCNAVRLVEKTESFEIITQKVKEND